MEYIYPSKDILEKHSKELDNSKYYNLSKLIFQKDFDKKLTFPVGIDEENNKYYIDFFQKSGMLISGETGSGKSVFLNSTIISLLMKNSPEELRFVFIDPRGVELNIYNGIPHLYGTVFSSEEESLKAMNYVINTMEGRRNLFASKGFKNIDSYNTLNEEKLPQLILVIDEAVDILKIKEAQDIIDKILFDGYKFGIHLILSTNAYFKSIFEKGVTDLFNYILTFDLASKEQADFIEISKADLLSIHGEALIKCQNDDLINIQTPFVSNRDIDEVVNFIKNNN